MTFLPRINDLVIVKDDPKAEVAQVVRERRGGQVVQCQFKDGATITACYDELRSADVDEEYRP